MTADPELDNKAAENLQRQIGVLIIENIRLATELALLKEREANRQVDTTKSQSP